jgi:hypothetical protein
VDVRPETILLLAAFAGAALVLAGYVDESRRGADAEVRHAWMDLVPQACALAGVGGLALARRRADKAAYALGLTNAAFTAMLTHATLALTTIQAPSEGSVAKLEPTLVIAGFLGLVLLLLFATQRPMPRPRLAWVVRGIAALAAILSVWQILRVASGVTAWRVAGALLGLAALVSAVRLAQRLVPRRTPR